MNLDELRTTSPLFEDIGDREFEILSAIAKPVTYEVDEILFRVNTPANCFFFVLDGTVALKISMPTRPTMTIQTLGEGALLGLSWRVKPYRWQWTAQALQQSKLARFDANEVLAACEQDHELDSAMWQMVARESTRRLQNVRMQLLDVYGRGDA